MQYPWFLVERKGASPTPQEAECSRASPTPQEATECSDASPTPQEATERSDTSPTPQEATGHSGASPTPQVQDLLEDELQQPHEDEEPLEAARNISKEESKPGPADGNYSHDSRRPNSVERPPGKRPRCGNGDHWVRDCSDCKREGTLGLPPIVATATLERVASPRISRTHNRLGYYPHKTVLCSGDVRVSTALLSTGATRGWQRRRSRDDG